jgi:hypothetical protein
MADIKLKCAKCGKEIAVSEFARLDALLCQCGEALRKPESLQAEAAKPKHTTLTLKAQEQIANEFSTPQDPTEWRFSQQTRKDESTQREPRNPHLLFSWLFFIAMAGIMAYLRYAPNNLFPDGTRLLKEYGIVVFAVLYVTVILSAFKDTIFQGLLCLIPLYPFYYIIMISDDFYLRAAVSGAMVGVGWDSLLIINKHSQIWIAYVQAWIASGG